MSGIGIGLEVGLMLQVGLGLGHKLEYGLR